MREQPMTGDRERVVVGVDGSAESLAAARWAVGEARYRHADVEIITCWYPPLVAEAAGYQVGFLDTDKYAAKARQVLEGAVASVTADADERCVEGPSVTGRLLEGAPGATLVRESKGAALVVVGRRGRGGLSRVLLGSVSRHVVDHAACPVVVVPAQVSSTVHCER
jgi:nucleotide-binding universal stress UspA family protein